MRVASFALRVKADSCQLNTLQRNNYSWAFGLSYLFRAGIDSQLHSIATPEKECQAC